MSHRSSRILTIAAGLAVLAPLVAAPLTAQDGPTGIALSRDLSPRELLLVSEQNELRNRDADALVIRALEAEEQGRAKLAAVRFERASALRNAMDPRRVDHLEAAARLHHVAGNSRQAGQTSLAVAEMRLERGDVAEASTWFRHAYFSFQSAGEEVRAQQAGWRACMLTLSPLLDQNERRQLQRGFTNCTMELDRVAVTGRH